MIENEAATVQWYRNYYANKGLRPGQFLGFYRFIAAGGAGPTLHGYQPYYNERRIDKATNLWQIEIDFLGDRMWINVPRHNLISNLK